MDDRQLFFGIGERIRQLRTERGISQQDLAALCDFEKSNMSRIESGKTNLTLKNMYKISRALGVRLSELVDFE
ncbi:helix-turn-helix transcriptional regulator [uncultured Alistipes sp.]|uniref:helix-turn-helix domain-containing protein n=1 Tax=uncultured Alistipes sp. TaxID=538949 RepID=UPI002619CDC2|nr:helix-turn-helix transcriptional regulator [uncultured Alistipes sp.]